MSDIVAIFGEGNLADIASRELSGICKVERRRDFGPGVPDGTGCGLVLQDDWRPAVWQAAEEAMRRAGVPWIGGYVFFDAGVVGPLVCPETPGCFHCAVSRWQAANRDLAFEPQRQMDLWKHGVIERDRFVSRAALLQTAQLAAAEARRLLERKPARTQGRMYRIDLHTLAGSLHAFLPDPLCPVCGGLPDDSPESAVLSLKPNPKPDPQTYRCRSTAELITAVEGRCLDEWSGLLTETVRDPAAPFCDVLARMPAFAGTVWTAGRSNRYGQSRLTAILEGLERYSGSLPRGKRTVIQDSWRNVKDRALHPAETGLYSAEQYADPEFPFEPFDDEAPIPWVWGYSFLRGRPILIPQALAYYESGFGGSFVSEGSNGCALGGTLEEAVFHGILELVERDAFLLTWYAQLPVPRIDPGSIEDPETLLMIERMRAVSGYDISIFNITMEHGIPSVWVLTKTRKPAGANLICAAGAHADPVRAVQSALFEIAGRAHDLEARLAAGRGELERMLDEPERVAEMPDHALLYALPQAEERLRFLLDQAGPSQLFREAFKPFPAHSDLTDDLQELLMRFRQLKLDVIVVDQTTPETGACGLHNVKVIIPGLLPMSFGHQLRRLSGLERVKKIPFRLGFRTSMLTDAELNPHPHPFL